MVVYRFFLEGLHVSSGMGYFYLANVAVGVICLVLHASGNGCPRYPPSTCRGPFTIRPSSAVKSPDLQSCDRDKALMESCLKQCMEDLCCRAFGAEDGKCTMMNFHTEAYHFVKEAHAWPLAAYTCLSNAGCSVAIGRVDGGQFSLRQTFIDAASDLRAISGEFDDETSLVKIEADYENGIKGSRVLREGVKSFLCQLDAGEYITGVTGYKYMAWGSVPLIKGIQFTTTLKTCGPYGLVTDLKETVSGHMLLYVAGYAGYGFDQLEFTFFKC